MLREETERQQSVHCLLYDKIPEDHLLKKVDRAVDFSFINELLEGGYCKNFGRPAKEPELIIRGWLGYLGIASMKTTMQRWDEWLRRRIRVYIWKQWKAPKARIRNLVKLGIPRYHAHKWGYMKAYWNVAGSPVLTRSITNERLVQAGYYSLLARYESLHLCD